MSLIPLGCKMEHGNGRSLRTLLQYVQAYTGCIAEHFSLAGKKPREHESYISALNRTQAGPARSRHSGRVSTSTCAVRWRCRGRIQRPPRTSAGSCESHVMSSFRGFGFNRKAHSVKASVIFRAPPCASLFTGLKRKIKITCEQ
jgi:hypothetical protein